MGPDGPIRRWADGEMRASPPPSAPSAPEAVRHPRSCLAFRHVEHERKLRPPLRGALPDIPIAASSRLMRVRTRTSTAVAEYAYLAAEGTAGDLA